MVVAGGRGGGGKKEEMIGTHGGHREGMGRSHKGTEKGDKLLYMAGRCGQDGQRLPGSVPGSTWG